MTSNWLCRAYIPHQFPSKAVECHEGNYHSIHPGYDVRVSGYLYDEHVFYDEELRTYNMHMIVTNPIPYGVPRSDDHYAHNIWHIPVDPADINYCTYFMDADGWPIYEGDIVEESLTDEDSIYWLVKYGHIGHNQNTNGFYVQWDILKDENFLNPDLDSKGNFWLTRRVGDSDTLVLVSHLVKSTDWEMIPKMPNGLQKPVRPPDAEHFFRSKSNFHVVGNKRNNPELMEKVGVVYDKGYNR